MSVKQKEAYAIAEAQRREGEKVCPRYRLGWSRIPAPFSLWDQSGVLGETRNDRAGSPTCRQTCSMTRGVLTIHCVK